MWQFRVVKLVAVERHLGGPFSEPLQEQVVCMCFVVKPFVLCCDLMQGEYFWVCFTNFE